MPRKQVFQFQLNECEVLFIVINYLKLLKVEKKAFIMYRVSCIKVSN